MKINKSLGQKALEMICKNKLVRTRITRNSHLWFFNIYFADYLEFETAPFQFELFDLTDRPDWNLLCLVAFRSSAKSTLMTLSYVLYSVLGMQEKKFVLIVAQTQAQAKQHMKNIRGALEHNETLRRDLGPFEDETEEWGASSIVFKGRNARISVASVSEAIRGIKHLQHRPDLIIIDDPEDLQSVRTKEGRDKTYQWFKGEIMPIGSKRTRIILIGNVLHERCLVMRVKEELSNGTMTGIYREYALIDAAGQSAWPGRFPTLADIEVERKRIGDDKSWFREYMLKIMPSDDQIVKRDWISYYDRLPENDPALPYRMSVCTVDPGTKSTGDPTAIVVGHLYGYGRNARIYISPTYFNKPLDFADIKEKIKEISSKVVPGARTNIVVEVVQAQTYLFQDLQSEGWPVSEFFPNKFGDKEQRLTGVSPLIQNGQVQFHRGCEEIINQIVNFGLENHDDLCDALVMVILYLTERMGHGPYGDMLREPVGSGEPDYYDPVWGHSLFSERTPEF